MTPQSFAALADQGYNRIPVARQVLADLDTPLSTYLKLADQPYTDLFESVQGGEKWGRYSMIGLPAREVIRVSGYTVQHLRDGEIIEEQEVNDPLAFIEEFQGRFRVPDLEGLPKFDGGLVGYFGYDTIRYIEPRLKDSCPEDEIGTPDIPLMVSEEVVVFDNLSGKLHLIVMADPSVSSFRKKPNSAWVNCAKLCVRLIRAKLVSFVRQRKLPKRIFARVLVSRNSWMPSIRLKNTYCLATSCSA